VRKPLLCLDFDGVIHSYKSGWKGESIVDDPPVPGAIEFIYTCLLRYRVAIYSSRSSSDAGVNAMQRWLERWCRQEHILGGEWWKEIEWPRHKPAAFLTIDDRAITFTGTFPTLYYISQFKPWFEENQSK
jgi:hypothetical protein